MMLSPKAKKALKAKAHALKPVVLLGAKGLTEAVIEEVNCALKAHELIKVKIAIGDKALKQETAEVLADAVEAEFISLMGHIVILYKERIEE